MTVKVLINVDVDDLGRAVSFYTGAFGLTLGRRLGPSAVELLGAGSPIYLLEKAAGTGAAPATAERRNFARHWTPVHLDLVVADLDAAVARAVTAGAALEFAPRTESWGRIAQLADPFGHGFCIIEFRGRGYDEIATA